MNGHWFVEADHRDGFFLDDNESEAIYLDDIIFLDLNSSQQEELNLQQYYGYVSNLVFHSEKVTAYISVNIN